MVSPETPPTGLGNKNRSFPYRLPKIRGKVNLKPQSTFFYKIPLKNIKTVFFCKLHPPSPSNISIAGAREGVGEGVSSLVDNFCGRTKKLAGEHLNRYFFSTRN